jgi:hypothetical protein
LRAARDRVQRQDAIDACVPDRVPAGAIVHREILRFEDRGAAAFMTKASRRPATTMPEGLSVFLTTRAAPRMRASRRRGAFSL